MVCAPIHCVYVTMAEERIITQRPEWWETSLLLSRLAPELKIFIGVQLAVTTCWPV